MPYDPDSRRDPNDLIRLLRRIWEPLHPGDAARKDWQASLAVAAADHLGFNDEDLDLVRRFASLYPLWDHPLADADREQFRTRFGSDAPAETVLELVQATALVPGSPPERVSSLVLAVIDYVVEQLGGEAAGPHPPEIDAAIRRASEIIQPLESRLKPLQGL